jgi:hypothetical protein
MKLVFTRSALEIYPGTMPPQRSEDEHGRIKVRAPVTTSFMTKTLETITKGGR